MIYNMACDIKSLLVIQGFDAMMDGDQVQPLRTLYDAVASGKGITELRAAFANYIKVT